MVDKAITPCLNESLHENSSVTDEVKATETLGTNCNTEEFGVMWTRILIK